MKIEARRKQKRKFHAKSPWIDVKEVRLLVLVEVEKVDPIFNLQIELSKVKISIPFKELLRNKEYIDKITEMVKGQGYF